MTCQRCASERLATVQSHASDMHNVQIGESESANYLPYDLGIGGGDDLRMTYCLQCGQIQGDFPLPLCALEIVEGSAAETESELDRLRRENTALTKLYGVAACLRQYPVPFDDHFALIGAVDECRQVVEPPIDEDDGP